MRKPISILLVIAMLLSVLSALTFTVSAEDEEEFTAVNLSLGYDIGMTYYTNIDYASNVTAQVTINGRTDTVRATNSNGKAAFSFNGIAPHELGSAITAEVYKGTTASEAVKETAIKDICALYLDNTFDTYEEETRDGIYKLVSNLLQYGECARIYKNVPDSILTDITSENYVPDTLGTPTGDKTTGSGNENLSLRGLNVFFDTTNRYYIKFATTDISKVRFTVGSTAYTEFGEEGGYYFFYTNPMSAKDTNNVVSIKGYYDNTKTIDLDYSIEQYIVDLAAVSASEGMQNLAKAIYNYSGSAESYTHLNFETRNYESKYSASSYKEFIMLNDYDMGAVINDDGSISLTYAGEVQATMPSEVITYDGNTLTITGTDTEYDGTYEIFDDGYLEKDGYPIAKAKLTWFNGNRYDYYDCYIIHNGVVYYSDDGNIFYPDEYEYIANEWSDALTAYEEYISLYNEHIEQIQESPEDAYLYGTYAIAVDNEEFNLRKFYDILAIKHSTDTSNNWTFTAFFYNSYNCYGASGHDMLVGNNFVTRAIWHDYNEDTTQLTAVEGIITTRTLKYIDGKMVQIPLNYVLSDGVYFTDRIEKYYHNGIETTNVFFVEDEPYYFEEGMTYRDWLNSSYSSAIANTRDTASYTSFHVFIPKDTLDEVIFPLDWAYCARTVPCHLLNGNYAGIEFSYVEGSGYWWSNDYIGCVDKQIVCRGASSVKIYYYDEHYVKRYLDVPFDGLTFYGYDIFYAIEELDDYDIWPRHDSNGIYEFYLEAQD